MTTRKAERPSKYSEKLAEMICRRLIEGESLRSICRDPAMPSRVTVTAWMEGMTLSLPSARAHGSFRATLWRTWCAISSTAAHLTRRRADRVKLAGLQWLAAKLHPKRYSDCGVMEVSGVDGGSVQIDRPLSPAEVTVKISSMLAENERLLGLPVEPAGVPDAVRLKTILGEKKPITAELYASTVSHRTGRGFPLDKGRQDGT